MHYLLTELLDNHLQSLYIALSLDKFSHHRVLRGLGEQ